MNLLLDTHTLIWFFDGSDNLSDEATVKIEDPVIGKFLSVASFWEIAIKISIGKLRMELSMENLERLVWENDMDILPIRIEHTFPLRNLPFHHKDPFDRLIVAQLLVEGMDIVSGDEVFDQYLENRTIKRIW
ncbi:type II toxin-antitoxin system VapC family toxin [Persicitalea sp.]|uniref:type II toxin-antitoxin system VapC family toxin n=1 Tax=Persicitalea sp. TaxID=3100273 RepID=UPI0035936BF8